MDPKKKQHLGSSNSKLPWLNGSFSFDDYFTTLAGETLPIMFHDDDDDDDDCLLSTRDQHQRESRSFGALDDSDGGEMLMTDNDGRVVGFPGMEELLPLIKDVLKQIVPLHREEESKMEALMADVGERDSKHRETVSNLERGADGMFQRLKTLESTVTRAGRLTGEICSELMAADSEMGIAQRTMRQVCDKGGVLPPSDDDFYTHEI